MSGDIRRSWILLLKINHVRKWRYTEKKMRKKFFRHHVNIKKMCSRIKIYCLTFHPIQLPLKQRGNIKIFDILSWERVVGEHVCIWIVSRNMNKQIVVPSNILAVGVFSDFQLLCIFCHNWHNDDLKLTKINNLLAIDDPSKILLCETFCTNSTEKFNETFICKSLNIQKKINCSVLYSSIILQHVCQQDAFSWRTSACICTCKIDISVRLVFHSPVRGATSANSSFCIYRGIWDTRQ